MEGVVLYMLGEKGYQQFEEAKKTVIREIDRRSAVQGDAFTAVEIVRNLVLPYKEQPYIFGMYVLAGRKYLALLHKECVLQCDRSAKAFSYYADEFCIPNARLLPVPYTSVFFEEHQCEYCLAIENRILNAKAGQVLEAQAVLKELGLPYLENRSLRRKYMGLARVVFRKLGRVGFLKKPAHNKSAALFERTAIEDPISI